MEAIKTMRKLAVLLLLNLSFAVYLNAQTSAFTYQGKLNDAGSAANGPYEMRFRLFNAGTGGEPQPQSAPITLDFTVAGGNAVPVANGVFTVRLDFTAAAFPGPARFLEISVRRTAADPWTLLDPRQPVTRAPQSLSADRLSDECDLCVTNSQIQSVDAGKVTGVVSISNGGTGSSTQNFVDLSTNQIIVGSKSFLQPTTLSNATITSFTSTGSATFNGAATFNGGDPVQMNALDIGNGLTADVASVSELNATNGVSGNFIDSQTNFRVAGTPVLTATSDYLFLGQGTGGGAGLTRATAIGHGTQVGASDSIVLGTTPGFFLPVPNTRVGIGVVSPTTKLDVGGQVLIRSNVGNVPTGGGLRGLLNVVQTGSGDANFYMQGAFGGRGINFATNVLAAGADARLIISHYDGTTYQNRFTISPTGDIGIGTITPVAKLDVAGTVRVGIIGIAGVTGVCFDASLILSSCSSSMRYKQNLASFTPGLDLVRQFRPVSFSWKSNNLRDMGLVAEEVAEIEPLLATYNNKGEVEGVKYDRIGVVLVNAVKEQQAQIERQEKLIAEQQRQIDDLKKLICSVTPAKGVCGKE